jgi:hypothetical protein
MRIVFISDTHLAHIPPNRIDVPDGDVLVHCGDATFRGTADEIAVFGEWLHYDLPHKRKVFVPGNHDLGFEDNWSQAVQLLPPTVDCLNASGVVIDGVKFWGSPWQPEFCNWAFNLPRGPALRAHWAKIPDDTDVLVTHSPPMGVLDRVYRSQEIIDHTTRLYDPKAPKPKRQFRRWREHVGCADMWQAVQRVQPKIHAFGHIHCDVGVKHHTWKEGPAKQPTNDTIFINAAICDDRYLPVHPAVVIDL